MPIKWSENHAGIPCIPLESQPLSAGSPLVRGVLDPRQHLSMQLLCGLGIPIPEDIILITAGIWATSAGFPWVVASLIMYAGVIIGDYLPTEAQGKVILAFLIGPLVLAVISTLGVLNLLRSPTGRAFVAIRDSEISAQSMGIHLAYYKTLSFAISAALAGLGGALYGHKMQFISPDQFSVLQSIDLLLMIVVGGLGSVHGAFLGALFLIVLPQLISLTKDSLPDAIALAPGLQSLVYGLVLIAFVLFEPMGLYGRWLKVRTYLQVFPFYRRGLFKRQKTFQKSERVR